MNSFLSICNPMFQVVKNGFCRKEPPFNFLPFTLILDRSQNWPDLRSPISKFRDIYFKDAATHINWWKFHGDRLVGVAMMNIQAFSDVRSLYVTWWPDLERPGSEIFATCAEKMYEQVCKNFGAELFCWMNKVKFHKHNFSPWHIKNKPMFLSISGE